MTESTATPFKFDPFGSNETANPDYYYKELRDKHPVYYHEEYDTYFFSRFEDVWEVLRVGDNTFIATETNLPTAEHLRTHRNNGAPSLASINPMAPGPSLHSPYYELMRQAHIAPLRPKGVAHLEDFVRDQARRQLGELIPRGSFDFSLDYAAIIPARVICHMFGLPLSVADTVMSNIRQIGRFDPERKGVDFSSFFSEVQQYIIPAIQARRQAGVDGSNGLIDGLINLSMPDGRPLDDQEICNQLVCAMVGGMESVPKVTGGGLLALRRMPEELAQVRADLDHNLPIAVEEMIRYCAPAQYTFRTAHKDVTVAGQFIRAGQRVACMLYSASRDDREFEQPDDFIWNRKIARVISFGLGQHHCIGKHLAQLEVRTLIREFLNHVGSFEFVLEEADSNVGYFQRGWTSLPVVFNPSH